MIIAHKSKRLLKREKLLAVGGLLACLATQAVVANPAMLERTGLPAPAPSIAARRTDLPALRVATIGYHLAHANNAACRSRTMLTGLMLHDRAAYDEKTRRLLTGLGHGFGVLGVVAGSPADAAGLKTGDEIIALEGTPLAAWRTDLEGRAATFARVEAFTATLSRTLSHGPAHVRIVHDGQERDTVLAQQSGCAVAFVLLPNRTPDAWTDGRYLAVTKGLAELVSDDALAFAMAHELAHVALGHTQEPARPLAGMGIGAGHVRKQEAEADLLGLCFVQTAGYDIAGAATLFRALAASGGWRIDFTHPSNSSRIATLTQEAVRLAQQPRTPEERERCLNQVANPEFIDQ